MLSPRNVRLQVLSISSSNSSNFAATAVHFYSRLYRRRLPQNVTLVPEIKRFLPIGPRFNEGEIELVNGTVGLISHILSANRNKNVRSFPELITSYLRRVTDTLSLSYHSTITLLLV